VQTLKGKKAMSVGISEFVERVMKNFFEAAQGVVEEFPAVFKPGYGPVWSFDNAKCHTGALRRGLLAQYGCTVTNRVPLPPLSHDLHKVVEHAIANTTSLFYRKLLIQKKTLKMDGYIRLLKAAFKEANTAARVGRDVASLRETYQQVALPVEEGGVEGGWPTKKYR